MSSTNVHLPLVINWHLTEACNFHCRYCYAKWDRSGSPRDLVRSGPKRGALLKAIHDYFRPDNPCNPLHDQLTWDGLRLNLAGGEPLLYQQELPELLAQALQVGFDTSIITNGHVLSETSIARIAPLLSWLGLSVDSHNEDTNRIIGRADARGRVITSPNLIRIAKAARNANPNLRIKLNTVVNRLNYRESLAPLLDSIAPDKWKVLRVLPVVTDDLSISHSQFESFVASHYAYRTIMTVEDNSAMTESYIMLDPFGRFFQNSVAPKQGYQYSDPILDAGIDQAFDQIKFNAIRFQSRYGSQAPTGGAR
ncbi:MAG: viperin family antiviral radical SAM protein [Moraxellaceae bacterium]|nr:viperin family antiviral radical SAM protein [Moraxellaceae bacterium]